MNYKPSPTAEAFHASTAFMRTLEGPIGGGGTTACFQEIIRQCKEMPLSMGKRRSRWMILSPSIDHRRDSAMRTFDSLAIDGVINSFSNELTRYCNFGQDDVIAEIIFRTSDAPEKYNNLEFTGAYICDIFKHKDEDALESVIGRVGRFPRMADCPKYQYGVIIDSCYNRAILMERRDAQFTQPSALSPDAENLENLPEGYYQNLIVGKTEDWIKKHITGDFS